jgi:hypothetical protein
MQPLKVWVDVIVIAFADQRQLEDIALNAGSPAHVVINNKLILFGFIL